MGEVEQGCVLITGAAVRIGRAIALDLGRRGWRVAVHYHRSATAAQEVVDEIVQSRGTAVALAADLATVDEIDDLINRAVAALGPVTCLINNAAIFEQDTMQTASAQSWDRHLAINLRAPFFLSQAMVRRLPPNAAGNIINVIDQRVWNLSPTYPSYTISKAGLWTLTRTLAMALAPRIRVNGIGPGPTLPSSGQTAAQFAAESQETPLGHGASPDDICAAVQYLLSADAVTGQMIVVDGGQHLPWPPPGTGRPTAD